MKVVGGEKDSGDSSRFRRADHILKMGASPAERPACMVCVTYGIFQAVLHGGAGNIAAQEVRNPGAPINPGPFSDVTVTQMGA